MLLTLNTLFQAPESNRVYWWLWVAAHLPADFNNHPENVFSQDDAILASPTCVSQWLSVHRWLVPKSSSQWATTCTAWQFGFRIDSFCVLFSYAHIHFRHCSPSKTCSSRWAAFKTKTLPLSGGRVFFHLECLISPRWRKSGDSVFVLVNACFCQSVSKNFMNPPEKNLY